MGNIVMLQLISGVNSFLDILSAVLVIYALMTWFMRPDNPIYVFFARIADVLISPFRPIASWVIEKLGLRIDISVILALVCIQILQGVLVSLASGMYYY